MKIECSAILFDLDGVLVDSSKSIEKNWRNWASQYNIDADKVYSACHGRPSIETMAEFAPSGLDIEREAEIFARIEAEDAEGVEAFLGASRILKSIPAGKWAIVTSGNLLVASSRIKAAGLPIPEVLVTSDRVSKGKPDPEGYQKAANLLGFPPHECVVVEDSSAGIKAGKASGAFVIEIRHKDNIVEKSISDARIERIEQMSVEACSSGSIGLTINLS